MGSQSFAVEAVSEAPPDVVFAWLADGARWNEWAGPLIRVSSWERQGDGEPGGVGAIRRLGTRRFVSREEIVTYDAPHRLGYVMLSGQPVRNYRSEVVLTQANGGTRIRWSSTFDPSVPGTGPILRGYLAAIVGSFARRLAHHASVTRNRS